MRFSTAVAAKLQPRPPVPARHPPDSLSLSPRSPQHSGVTRARLVAAVGLVGALVLAAGAQDTDPRELRVQGFVPAGPRTSVTESRGTLSFTVVNHDDTDKDARVVVFYTDQPGVQYARDVWVPARSSITTWVPIGPAPPGTQTIGRQIEMLLYDRTGGTDRLVLPAGEEKTRTRMVFYRKREPATAVMLDWGPEDAFGEREQPQAEAVNQLVRLVRESVNLSDYVSPIPDGPLPPAPDTFDGIDVFVLAGNRLRQDPPGRTALRQWVQQGGTLWVMLDRVDSAVVDPILGDDAPLTVVDRVGLTTIRLSRISDDPAAADTWDVERPVDLVRVIPSASDQVFYVANGWPAAFTRQLGRGKVLVTTLGDRGWVKTDVPRDPRTPGRPTTSGPQRKVDLSMATEAVSELASELHPPAPANPLTPEVLQPLLTEEIGYTIVGRSTAALILGGFVGVLLVLGLVLRRSRRPELVGWLIPVAAVAAAALLVGLGELSRRSIPPTAGAVALVDPVPGSGEAALTGLYALFNPASGPVAVGSNQGAILDLDTEGLTGQLRRRLQKDTDVWAWDGLSLPAGVRTGPFRATARTGRIAAVARFGPNGIEGRLETGTYRGATDALVVPPGRSPPSREPPSREPLPVRFGADGTFTATGADALPQGNYIAGVVLDDRQQRRQAVYRQLFAGPLPRHLEGRPLLLAWAESGELPFIPPAEGTRVIGSSLLAVPMEFERPAPGSRVTIPRGFSTVRRVLDETHTLPVNTIGTESTDMRLRFQLPATVLPLEVEKVTVHARIHAPSRKFTLSTGTDGKPVPLFEGTGSLDSIRVDVADPKQLQPDGRGGLYLNLSFASSTDKVSNPEWKIEWLTLEVVGRTAEK